MGLGDVRAVRSSAVSKYSFANLDWTVSLMSKRFGPCKGLAKSRAIKLKLQAKQEHKTTLATKLATRSRRLGIVHENEHGSV
jgi:hypothetical protein